MANLILTKSNAVVDGPITIGNASTGILEGGALSIGGGSPITTFNVSSGSGLIVDHSTTPTNPTVVTVTWPDITGITATNIGVSDATAVFIDSTGSVVQLPLVSDTNQDHKDKIFIGQITHPINEIQALRSVSDPAYGGAERLGDLSRAMGPFNVTGNIYGPNGINLFINKSAGNSYSAGINFQNNIENPDVSTDVVQNALTFRYSYRDGVGGFTENGSTTAVSPSLYDDGDGTLGAIPGGRWSIQHIYFFPGADETRIEYGQTTYTSQSAALAAIPEITHASNPDYGVGVLRGYLVIASGATDLSDPNDAVFVEAPKFGSGGGASSTTSLQQAYNNSVPPEIVTDGTRGAVTIREGVAVGGNLIEGEDDTATQVFAVDVAGDVTISGSGAPMTVRVVNGQPMLMLTDTTRGSPNKILSVAEQNLVFSENQLTENDWLDIGNAIDADSGYIADFDGTVVFATGHCENTNVNSKNIHLFINGVDQGSVGALSGGTDASFINTTLDVDFVQGDKIRLQAQQGTGGGIQDTVVKLTVKWRV